MADNRYYYFKDAKGNRHTVDKTAYDKDPMGFAKAFPGARMEVIDRKTGRRGDVSVKDASRVGDFGAHLFTGRTITRGKGKPNSSALGRAQQSVAQEKWGGGVVTHENTTASENVSAPKRNAVTLDDWNGGTTGKESELVKGLRAADMIRKRDEEQMPIDYTKPGAVKQMVGGARRAQKSLERRMEQAGQEAGRNAEGEIRRRNAPAFDLGNENVNNNLVKTRGQLEKEMEESAATIADKNFADTFANMIAGERQAAEKRGFDAYLQRTVFSATPMGSTLLGTIAYNAERDPAKLQQNLLNTLGKNMESMLSDPNVAQKVVTESKRLGVDPEDYVKTALMPSIQNKLMSEYDKTELKEWMPRNTFVDIIDGLGDGFQVGSILDAALTKAQRQYRQRAIIATQNDENPYYQRDKYGVTEGVRSALSLASDVIGPGGGVLGGIGKGVGAASAKVFGNEVKTIARMANMSKLQRMFKPSILMRGAAETGANFGIYEGLKGAQSYSSTTDDVKLGEMLENSAVSAAHGAVSGATLGVVGKMLGGLGYNVGIKGPMGVDPNFGKNMLKGLGMKGVQIIGEGTAFYAGGNFNNALSGADTDWSAGNLLSNIMAAGIYKIVSTHTATGAANMLTPEKGQSYGGSVAVKFGTALYKAAMAPSAQGKAFAFTPDEKQQLFASGDKAGLPGKEGSFGRQDILTWAERVMKATPVGKEDKSGNVKVAREYYESVMQDPNVSWDAKMKLNALLGIAPATRPEMDMRTYTIEDGKRYVNEYAKDGTLLSKRSYKNMEQREAIEYDLMMQKENQRMLNGLGYILNRDCSRMDLQMEFLRQHDYDFDNPDSPRNQAIMDDMLGNNKTLTLKRGRTLHDEWLDFVSENGITTKLIKDIADAHGLSVEEMFKIVNKEPIKRTEEEQRACVELRKALNNIVYEDGMPHADQADSDGKDVVEENNLGTENPNNEAVAEVLNNMNNAEKAFNAALESNDVLKQEYERLTKEGLSEPQIYMELFNSGLTQEELAPFADYINAKAKAVGMYRGTEQKIAETVQKHVEQWSYKGELNGEKQEGGQILFVKDNNGRVLIVGAGDVAFDNEGKARESVGDMLSVLDPNTKEMDFVSKKDVQLDHVEKTEDYAKNYQEMLEVKNSVVYAQNEQQKQMENAAGGVSPEGGKPNGEEGVKHSYTLGEKKAGNGEPFYQDESGNIDLATIPDEVFEGIGYTKAPFRLTPSMIKHMLDRHNKELGFKDEGEAINFVVDVMNNFDHVRLGYDGALVFSIENGRKRTGKRAVTVLINSDNGEFYGLKTSGYEGIKGLEKRPLLWERGANETSSTDAASASVTTSKGPISGGQSGSASHQGNGLHGKDSNNSANGNGSNETLTFADGSPVPMMKDTKGRETADYSQMTPEHGAEWMSSQFGENAEAAVDGQIKRAEKMLKKAEKIKVDYTGDLNDAKEAEAQKAKAVDAAKAELELYTNIKKVMTANKVKAGMEKVGAVGEEGSVSEAGNLGAVREKFESGKRIVGNKRTRTLADGSKLRGHYEIVEADSLTPSHNANDGYKKSEGFPVNEEGRTINDRDYENDKQAQMVTDMIAMKYDGQAVDQVPVVTSDGIVVDGNGRTMAGQKAAKNGTDSAYLEALKENAENYGFTAEQIEQSGIKHPRLVLVSDEPMKYDTATFAKFNKNEKKSQGNTQQAVANSKKLSADEIGTIISEIEGSGSLDAFFNNPTAINSLLKRLIDKGVIGLNEVAGLREGENKLSASGKDFVRNLLLGSVFSEDTIRMMGADAGLKSKALNGIRAVLDNMKLDDYALRGEIDKAVQLVYEARQQGGDVDAYLRTPAMFGENAADRYDPVSQAIALALDGKAEDFRDLMMAYNRNAAHYADANQLDVFGDRPTKEEFINEFLKLRNWKNYETRRSENEGNGDVGGTQGSEPETPGGNEPTEEQREVDKTVKDKPHGVSLSLPKPGEQPKVVSEGTVKERKQALLEEIDRGGITRKDDAFKLLYKTQDLLDDYHGIPHDEWGAEPSRKNSIDTILGWARNNLEKIKDEPIEPATEKQISYIDRLTTDDPATRKGLEGLKLNKKQASWLIDRIKTLDDNLMGLHPDDIAEAEKEIHDGIEYFKKANGFEPKGEEPLDILPKKEEKTFDPIGKAAENYKKDHPLTEGEIRSSDVDDIAKDMAVDFLNGEVTDDLHRAVYESIYEKVKDAKMKNATKQADNKTETTETPKVEASASPIEGMKNAAEKFAKEKEAAAEAMGKVKKPQQKADDAAVEASNKKVNDLWNDLLKAGREDLSASFIGLNARQLEVLPKLVSAMAENAYLRIKRGMHNLEDVVKEMRKEFAPVAQVFKKEDVDAIYEQMMNIRYRDGEQRMSLKEWADYYEKSSPKHKEELVGDSKTAEERKQAEKKFIDAVKLQLAFGRKFKSIIELRKIAERHGLKDIKDTDLQELAEAAIVMKARGIASSASTNDAKKFELIKKLYENQPSLNQRDSERVMKQQYSTPAPYAFLADMYVKAGIEVKSALEPSAGNGMLTIGLPKDAVHVNDIDAQRLANLQRQGFKNVTSQDGTQPFADKDVDVVVTNPPFGSATPRDYDGYTISTLEGQMAINALESMKDNGRAAIIIGGKTEYAKNGSLNPKDKAFLGYLYSHYNVEDVINVDGSLYAKQGTTYPTRIILINGRRFDENAYPPVKDKARAEAVKSYDELYKRINDDILRSGRMDSPVGNGGEDANAKPNRPSVANTNEEGVRAGGSRESEQKPSVRTGGVHDKTAEPVSDNVLGTEGGTKPGENGGLPDGTTGANGAGADVTQSEGAGNNPNPEGRVLGSGENGRPNTQSNADGATNTGSGGRPRGQLERVDRPVRGLSTEKVAYAPRSGNPFTLQSVMPADQQEPVKKNLEKLGDADQFLVEELGYNDKEDLYSHLAAEQVDSVALALQQAKKGNAFIIGDQTGIGKGRQAASFVRYAIKNSQIPIYFTKTPELLSDVYRDLVDVGSPELRPFILGDKNRANVTDSEGSIVYKVPSKKEKQRVLDYIEEHGELPKEYDYILTTYSQVGNGVYEFDENGNRKERKLAKGKKFGAAAISGQARRDAIEKLMENGYLILDESHTAGGDSGQGNYFQHIIQKAKNVTFFSATFAKRPDNMPIYALRTAMNQGGLKASDLIDAVKRGGATLQEIMSQALTQCGQMIRRERDMTGVTIDWKAIDDPEVVTEQREQYDSIIGLFNDIINFQRTYVSAYVDRRNEELAEVQSSMGIKRGTEALGIKNQPFASKAFNTVQQVLLSLKAKSAAERAIDYLKQGMKPVIALSNTNESQTNKIKLGEEMDTPDLGTSLKKGLEGTLRYTSKNAKDESESGYINLSDLGADAVEAYHALEEKIIKTSTGLSLSPIDVIKNELTKAGYKVGELTGRQTEFAYNENGTVTKVKRADTDKKKLAREFNDGQIDALILNKSAATGISLHASSKYADQRKRVMIVAQQQLDVNDEVQMRGRIDRTGQVARGAYEYVVSLIPAEQRLLMMFKAKLKSLDANTTSSQKSKFNEMEVADITNKYGDKVVKEYMAEHLDLYARMADPFGWEKSYGADLSTVDPQKLVAYSDGKSSDAGGDASKLLGRMALLKVKEQEKMLQEIGDLYAAEIQRLNEMGENDLEITELPLKAKTINKGIWKEGSEPGGNNAFADNTYVEKVNMAVLKKPMKAEEVKKAQDGLTGNRSWDEYRKEKITAAKEYFDNKIAEATEKYEERAVKTATKAKEKYIKDAKKAQKDTGMSDEQIEKMAGYQYDSVYGDEKTKLDEVVKNLKSKYGVFERALETFNTDDAFVLPTDMNNPAELSGFGNSYGRLIDIKITDNFSPNASTVSFATLDGRRKITFPINGKVGIGSDKADVIGIIDRLTRQASAMGDKHLRVLSMDASNWDKLTSNESRKDGYIITGNLLQALIDTKEQGLGGQLVKYTTDTGEVKTGILMPEKFEPNGLANEKPINSVAEKFELPSNKGGITEITSSDGDVKIEQGFDYIKMTRNYTIRVPKSNKKGGKYFLDKELLKMVDGGNFETRGNTMLAEVKEEKLKDVLDRLSELGVKVKEESKVHYRIEPSDASLSLSKPLEGRIAETVEKVSKQTGGKVKMVNSVEEIGNPKVRKDIENGKQVTGWYDEKTGEVHLYMPNIHDTYTAEKTVWHETVGHKGMRGLLGDKFNDYMRSLWMDLDNPINAELRAYVKEKMNMNHLGFYDAIEEFIAKSAEDGKGEPGFWNYIKNKVTDALHEIGYRVSPNVKDVKYMLWLAKNVQKHGDSPLWKMRAEAVKWKIEHEKTLSVVEENGMMYDNNGKKHGLLDLNKKDFDEATDGHVHYRTSPMTASKIEEYNRRLSTKWYAFKESTVDDMQSLQEAMQIISGVKDAYADIPSAFNPLQCHNRMGSMVMQMCERYDREYTEPLGDAFKKVVSAMPGKDGAEQTRNANLYFIKKHGLERNRVLFVRDWFRKMEKTEGADSEGLDNLDKAWKGERSDLRRALDSGLIDLREYYRQMDEWIVQNLYKDFKAEEHDYSGMHGIYDVKKGEEYDDANVIDEVMSTESQLGADLVKSFWDAKKKATDFTIDQEYANGFMDKNGRDHLKEMFDWYVPLRKFDETVAEDVYGYISGGDTKNDIGSVIEKARGRESLSDVNVLAQISALAKSSILNGGKNVERQHFMRFVEAYEKGDAKDRIFVEIKPWVEKHVVDGNEVWEEVMPNIPENSTQEQINDILNTFEDTMKAKQAHGEAKIARRKSDIGYKFERSSDMNQHIVNVYVNGRVRRFVCQGNPRAAQAINGMLRDSGTRGWVSEKSAELNRFCAQLNTSLNPDFISSNLMRDLTFASANLTKEGMGYTWDFCLEYAKNWASMARRKDGSFDGGYLGMFRRYKEGRSDANNQKERWFKEFMDNGGETGFVSLKKYEDIIKEYENLVKTGNKEGDRWLMKKLKEGGVLIELANEVVENVARYSTYCVSRKRGRSIGKSIYDAKEVSSNFNRHGSGDAIKSLKTEYDGKTDIAFRNSLGWFNSYMKNHTMFYNAGVQGANLFTKNLKHAPKTAAIAFGAMPFGLNIAVALLNQLLISQEDEKKRNGVKNPYAELPEWKRRNNLCIYWGGGKFKTIPMGIELRAFYGLGDIAAGYMVDESLKSDTPIGLDIIGQMAQLVPASDFLGHHYPSSGIKELGEDVILSVIPTTAKPELELAFNRDWTGRPIYRDNDYLDKAPRWKRAYDSTNDAYMTINKWANKTFNGIDSTNEDLKGSGMMADAVDFFTAPYGLQHIVEGYTGGAGATIGRTYQTGKSLVKGVVSGVKDDKGFAEGFNKEWDKVNPNTIPFYRVFNYTPKEGNDMQRTKSKWYNYADELEQLKYNMQQMKTNTPDTAKNIHNAASKFKTSQSKDGRKLKIYEAADRYITAKRRILKRAKDKAVVEAVNEAINRKMQEAVEDLDRIE